MLKFLTLFLTLALSVFSASLPSQLTGSLEYSGLKENQLAQIEFISVRTEGDKTILKAILRLHFGDFSSREYIAYRFDGVEYSAQSGQVTFTRPSGPITLRASHFRSRSGDLEAEAWSTYANERLGTLRLDSKHRREKPNGPILEPLWGEYKGKCDGVNSTLQIKVDRVSSLSEGTENPFRSYKIFAVLAEPDPTSGFLCHRIPPRPCVKHVYTRGQYDFFSGKMHLFGTPSVSCQVRSEGITCDGCTYRRVSDETKEPRVWTPVENTSIFPKVLPERQSDIRAVSGSYTGDLHLSYLNVYQKAKLHFLPAIGSDPTKFNAMATLYFGGTDSSEFLDYRFDPIFLSPTGTQKVLLVSEGGRTDAMLELKTLTEDTVAGVWYSSLYGKVGDFYMTKDNRWKLPAGQKAMEPVGAHYLWTREANSGPLDFDLYLPVIREDVPPFIFGAQPFFPLNFNGYWTNRQNMFKKTPMPGGSYDFFTGRISFGGSLLGYRNSRSEVYVTPAVPISNGMALESIVPEAITYLGPLEW